MKKLTVEEVKNIQVDILSEVDDFCRKNNIKYFLGYGTLLGAVRHGGYIPWDDDIDICMKREDYDKFLLTFNNENSDYQVLHCSVDKNYPYEFAKVQKKSTKLIENMGIKYDIGINIDIFVIDNICDNKQNAFDLFNKMKFYVNIITIKFALFHNNRGMIKQTMMIFCKLFAKMFSLKYCMNKINNISKTYREEKNSKYVACLCQRWFGKNEILEKKWLDNMIELDFENKKFFAPSDYDIILKTWYGDYMKLPPEEQRVTHHDYEAYIEN